MKLLTQLWLQLVHTFVWALIRLTQQHQEGGKPKQEGGKPQPTKKKNSNDKTVEDSNASKKSSVLDESSSIFQARQLGLTDAANQHCDAMMDGVEPAIMGQIRVGEEAGSGAYAYLIQKPAGGPFWV